MAYNLIIQQGATFRLQITYVDDSDDPIDLTGITARMMIRETYADSIPVLSLTDVLSADGQLLLGGALGTVDLIIVAAKTTLLVAEDYVYDIELVNGSDVVRLLEGHVVVTPEVTR